MRNNLLDTDPFANMQEIFNKLKIKNNYKDYNSLRNRRNKRNNGLASDDGARGSRALQDTSCIAKGVTFTANQDVTSVTRLYASVTSVTFNNVAIANKRNKHKAPETCFCSDVVASVTPVTSENYELYEERAAILEFEAGYSRTAAEKMALKEIILLCAKGK